MSIPAIVIHGGSGTLPASINDPEVRQRYLDALQAALDAGFDKLDQEQSAMEAVTTAVSALEDCELFNAGKGSVFTAAGQHEMDAAMMDGETREAGAVTGIQGLKNPIQFARLILEQSPFIFLSGDKASEYAREKGLAFEPESYFFNQHRYDQWQAVKGSDDVKLDHSSDTGQPLGTVGAVAVDVNGNLAAATSTGGMTNKAHGRIGDSPMIGAGTYAQNETCAVSCTGYGEYFIRTVAAYDVSCRMKYEKESLKDAAKQTIQAIEQLGGTGGLIAVDSRGNIATPFNTDGMYRAIKSRHQNTASIS